MAAKKMGNLFNNPSRARDKLPPPGGVGFDNPRENIDPHVKTKTVSTREICKIPIALILTKTFGFTLLDPFSVYDIDTQVPFGVSRAALKITRVKVSLNTTGQEIAGDIKYADDLATFANATLIRAFDTSSGVLDATGLSISVPSGKELYIQFDSQPNSVITWAAFHIEWDFE